MRYDEEGGGVRSGPGAARTTLLFHIISARPSKQPLMVCTFLRVYMELCSYLLLLQEQIKDIIITSCPRLHSCVCCSGDCWCDESCCAAGLHGAGIVWPGCILKEPLTALFWPAKVALSMESTGVEVTVSSTNKQHTLSTDL